MGHRAPAPVTGERLLEVLRCRSVVPALDEQDPEELVGVAVLGSEAKGFSDGVRDCIESFVSVPRSGSGESLNVSIAGSIILAYLAHQRGTGEL